MASIFTRIIKGEIPCEKIAESTHEIAFLDIAPWVKGHTLIVPKREVIKLEELPPEEAASLMLFLQKIGKAISLAYGNADFNILLNNGPEAGQEVPHVHFHIVPRPAGIRFDFRQRHKYAEGEMKQVGEKIRQAL